jgi:hypothetical protein
MMSNYATASQYGAAAGSSYNADITLYLYQINAGSVGNGAAAPDTIYTPADATELSSVTQSFAINYRPEADPSATPGGCGGGNSNAYLVSANVFSCGQLAALTFNLPNVALNTADNYIWVATIDGGSDPAAQSLNWAINNLTSAITPAMNPQWDTNYPGGVGDTGWGSIGQGEIAFVAGVPEPATLGLIGLGLLGIGISVRKKSSKN